MRARASCRGGVQPGRRAPRTSSSIVVAGPDRAAFRRETAHVHRIGSDRLIAGRQNLADYQKKHWTGSFAEYLDIVRNDPKVTRTAYQRLYDMIISYGTEEYIDNKKKLVRYNFFKDPDNHGEDAIFGLEHPADEPGQRPQERRRGLRDREARHPAARPGRQLQEHASRGCSRRGSSAYSRSTTGRSTPSAGARRDPTARTSTPTARCTRSRCTSSRRSDRAEVTRQL